MNTKYTRILFLMIAIIVLGSSAVSAQPVFLSTPIEMDEGRKTIPQGERISAPGNVQASDGSYNDRVAITWDSVSEVDHYELYVNTEDDYSSASLLDTSWSTSYDDYYALGGTYYYYWVKACDTSECSDFSSPDSGYIDLDPPTSVSATDGTYTYEVEVSWQLYSRRVSIPVEIWRNDSNNSSGAGYVDTSYGSPYSDSSAEPGKYYYYWVKACGDDFCSEFSYSDEGFMAMEPPTGVSATDGTYNDRVDVEWNVGSVSFYEIFRNTSNDHSDATSLATEYGPPFSDWTAEAGTVYYYWVKACGPGPVLRFFHFRQRLPARIGLPAVPAAHP